MLPSTNKRRKSYATKLQDTLAQCPVEGAKIPGSQRFSGGPAGPPEAARSLSALLEKIGLFFWPLFCTPIAKNRVELFEGPVSGFEIRPVLARWYGIVRNG